MAQTQWPVPTEALPPLDRRHKVSKSKKKKFIEARARALLPLIDMSHLQMRYALLHELAWEVAALIDKAPDKPSWWRAIGSNGNKMQRSKFDRKVATRMAGIIRKEGLSNGVEDTPGASVNSQMLTTFTRTAAYPIRAALQTSLNDRLSPPVPSQQSGVGETEFGIANQVAWAYGDPVLGSKTQAKLENEMRTEMLIPVDDAHTDSKSSIITTPPHLSNVFEEIQSLRQDIAHLIKEAENARADARESQGKIVELSRIVTESKEALDRMEKRTLDVEVELFLLKMRLPESDTKESKRQEGKD